MSAVARAEDLVRAGWLMGAWETGCHHPCRWWHDELERRVVFTHLDGRDWRLTVSDEAVLSRGRDLLEVVRGWLLACHASDPLAPSRSYPAPPGSVPPQPLVS